MGRGWGTLAPLGIGFIIAFMVHASARSEPIGDHAAGHDWYRQMTDPEFSSNCCENDCAEVDPADVTEMAQGYRLTLSAEEASRIAGTLTSPVDAIIPWSRVQSVPRGKKGLFHACIMGSSRELPRGGVRCFFATPTM